MNDPRLVLMVLLLLVWPQAGRAMESCERRAQAVEIAPGVYVRPGKHGLVFDREGVANIGFIVGNRCVAVIDTGGSQAEGEALRCAIESVTSQPVCFVVNTHVHPDHVLGNLAFREPGVFYIGHARLARAMALRGTVYLERAAQGTGRQLDPEHIVLPDLSVTGQLRLDLGERMLQLVAHPTAHTDNDLSVYDEETGTLWLSDLLFMEHVPVVDGSLKGWLSLIETLKNTPAQRVVPGHGPVQAAWPDALNDTHRYLSTLLEETRTRMNSGDDITEAQQTVAYGEREHWRLFDDYHRRNVIAAYTELEWED